MPAAGGHPAAKLSRFPYMREVAFHFSPYCPPTISLIQLSPFSTKIQWATRSRPIWSGFMELGTSDWWWRLGNQMAVFVTSFLRNKMSSAFGSERGVARRGVDSNWAGEEGKASSTLSKHDVYSKACGSQRRGDGAGRSLAKGLDDTTRTEKDNRSRLTYRG